MITDVYIPKVDIDILRAQHMDLIETLWGKPDDILWGLVEMLDYILDEYDVGIDNEYQQLLNFEHNDNKE